jgi:catechol 2,3-dioxygenase-like lactoylglutathione lyase family enzyme
MTKAAFADSRTQWKLLKNREGITMAIELNHTIVHANDKRKSATFLSEILGLPAPVPFSIFLIVRTENRVSLDFIETSEKFDKQHYAFLVTEKDFDQIFARIKERKLPYWADPGKRQPGQTYIFNGGRGVYFEDPSGHLLEILTRPNVD